jgi:peptidoglycan/LPS O-acetylase OafA/YrhL
MQFKMNLDQAFNSKSNSFGFLRLFFAILVVLQHSYILGGFGQELDPIFLLSNHQLASGSLAVHSFFVISGFLIVRSYLRTDNLWRYLWHRIIRIFPGFWVCLVTIAFLFAPIIYLRQYGNLNGYFSINDDSAIDYVLNNLFLLINQPDIANLMSSHVEKSLNGSLWTLEWEFILYLVIGFLGASSILKKYRKIVLILFIIFFVTYLLDPCHCSILLRYYTSKREPPLISLFLMGSIFWLYADKVIIDFRLLLISFLISILAIQLEIYQFVEIFTLPYIVIWLAIKLPFINFEKHGDYSYGIYIYSFPIQQVLKQFGSEKTGIYNYFILSLLLTMPFAFVSWHLIEKQCVKLKDISKNNLRKL